MEHEANTAGLPEAAAASLGAQRSDRHMVGPDAPLPSHSSDGGSGELGEGGAVRETTRAPLNSQSSSGVGGTSKGRGEGGLKRLEGTERLVKEARWNRKSAVCVTGSKLIPTAPSDTFTEADWMYCDCLSWAAWTKSQVKEYISIWILSPLFRTGAATND